MRPRPWLLAVLLSLPVALPAPAQSDRLLVPVVYNGPGANGSQWGTSLQALNRTEAPLQSPGLRFLTTACPIPEGCEVEALPARAYGRVSTIGESHSAPGGLFMYLPAGQRSKIALSLKLVSLLENRGFWTEVPIVGQEEFRADGVWLLSTRVQAPFGLSERALLRVYDADGRGGRVRINAYPWYALTASPLASVELELRPRSETAPDGQPLYPGYAELRVDETFTVPKYGNTVWNLEIVPLPRTDGSQMRVWGFVTLTNNETNQVTVISPQ